MITNAIITNAIINDKCMDKFHWPAADTHKHKRGRLCVFSGDELYTGAARLAANCGARIGAGWVKIFAPLLAARIIATHETSIMVEEYEYERRLPEGFASYDACVIGPALGFGKGKYAALKTILSLGVKVVLDADALSMIANDVSEYGLSNIINVRDGETILTPHEGEFYRLFPKVPTDNLNDKIIDTVQAAKEINAVIVHKGAKTVIANPDGDYAVLDKSTPWLATAGTGDCLAGMIGGLLAQGVGAFDAAKIAVFLHAECAKLHGAGLMAQDIPQIIPEILDEFAPEELKAR